MYRRLMLPYESIQAGSHLICLGLDNGGAVGTRYNAIRGTLSES